MTLMLTWTQRENSESGVCVTCEIALCSRGGGGGEQ